MTLDDKLSMIKGSAEDAATNEYEAGYISGTPRLGIPGLRLSKSPPGVITRRDSTSMASTMALAASFSRQDAEENGKVIGRDARSLGQDLVLEPFATMDRDTSWGRAFNTYGEDPLLTARTGAAHQGRPVSRPQGPRPRARLRRGHGQAHGSPLTGFPPPSDPTWPGLTRRSWIGICSKPGRPAPGRNQPQRHLWRT